MVQAGHCFCFRAEAFHEVRRCELACRHDLYCDEPVDPRLARAINNAHAASRHLCDQLVGTKRTGQRRLPDS